MFRKGLFAVVAALSLVVAASASADHKTRTYAVSITNLTYGQVLTPPVVISHKKHFLVFAVGEVAEEPLYTMAEEGDNSLLAAHLEAEDDVKDVVAASGPIPPGMSATFIVKGSRKYSRFSAFGMLPTTHDAFFALQGARLTSYGSTHDAIAYDSGTEFNREACATIPGPPCGMHVRMTAGAEGFIYVSNGVHGGADLIPPLHDWRGPVARISVKRYDPDDDDDDDD